MRFCSEFDGNILNKMEKKVNKSNERTENNLIGINYPVGKIAKKTV